MNWKKGCAALLTALLTLPILAAADVKVGDHVFFGSYEQDNDLTDGKEPIEWRVLSTDVDGSLLISQYALDVLPYDTEHSSASWIDSSIRAWLNNDFLLGSFTEAEGEQIIPQNLENYREKDSRDTVFLLSNDEAKRLFADHADRRAEPTAYCLTKGPYLSRKYTGKVHWWLRSISWESRARAAFVAASGGVMTCGGDSDGRISNTWICVRPAIVVKTDTLMKLIDNSEEKAEKG